MPRRSRRRRRGGDAAPCGRRLRAAGYTAAKAAALATAAGRRLTLDGVEPLLDVLSALRRLVEQSVEADRLRRPSDRAAASEAPNH